MSNRISFLHKLILFAVFVPTIFTVGGNLTRFWQKNNFAQFLRHGVQKKTPLKIRHWEIYTCAQKLAGSRISLYRINGTIPKINK